MKLLWEGNPDDGALRRIGQVTFLHIASDTEIPPEMRNAIWFSCMTEQIHFLIDATGETIGYLCWAHFCRESLTILRRDHVLPAYIYEWQDGEHPCLFYSFILPRYRSPHSLLRARSWKSLPEGRPWFIWRNRQVRQYRRRTA